MLIGKEFEKEIGMSATRMCSNHLADHIRNIYLEKQNIGLAEWEEAFSERADVIPSLQKEGFYRLEGIDYLFRWWGESKTRELGGEIIVVWRIREKDDTESFYRTWLKLAERDFRIGSAGNETRRRALFREEFAQAFETWKTFFSSNK